MSLSPTKKLRKMFDALQLNRDWPTENALHPIRAGGLIEAVVLVRQMSAAKKIVLIAHRAYQDGDENFLRTLHERKVELFCAVGQHAHSWEDAMDLVCTDAANPFDHHITTTAHTDEPVSDVMNMAELWYVEGGNDVEVIEL
jgi:hypothetical protein